MSVTDYPQHDSWYSNLKCLEKEGNQKTLNRSAKGNNSRRIMEAVKGKKKIYKLFEEDFEFWRSYHKIQTSHQQQKLEM